MRTVRFTRELAQPITLFDSTGAASVPLGDGSGEAHVYWIHIEAGGCIGAHPAGFGQLFLVVAGSGWVAGADGVRTYYALDAAFYLAYGVLSGQAPMDNLMLNAPHIAIATVMLGLVYWWAPRSGAPAAAR